MAAPKRYRVKAAAAVINVGKPSERYLYRGATIPAAVDAAEVKRLLGLGLIEVAPTTPEAKPQTPSTPSGTGTSGEQTPPADK